MVNIRPSEAMNAEININYYDNLYENIGKHNKEQKIKFIENNIANGIPHHFNPVGKCFPEKIFYREAG